MCEFYWVRVKGEDADSLAEVTTNSELQGLARTVADLPPSGPAMTRSVPALIEATRTRRAALATLVAEVEAGRRPCLRLADRTGATLVLSRSLAPDAVLRLTRFEGAAPVGHVEYRATEAGRAQVLRDLAGTVSGNPAPAEAAAPPSRTRDADLPAVGSFHG